MKQTLMDAMYHIAGRTCIRFKERTNEKDYVRIISGIGCWSYVGRQGIGAQNLSLGEGCNFIRTHIHELVHAIGFYHEHNRADRDSYVKIKWENIDKSNLFAIFYFK